VFSDKSLHAEAGAMRLPDFHPLVLALADKLGVKRHLFYNADVAPGARQVGSVPPVVYKAFTGETWTNGRPTRFTAPSATMRSYLQVNGMRVTRGDYANSPGAVNRSFGASVTTTMSAAVDKALAPVTVPSNLKIDKQITSWAKVIRKFDNYSAHRYLVEYAGWDLAQVQAAGTLENMTSRLHYSLIPTLMDRAIINPTSRYCGSSKAAPRH
jgi:monoamine oxidase